MQINEISVTGLFGTFDHKISFTHIDRVTIIHGPNGFGKTMMLKMIAAFIEGRTGIFERIPFKEFSVLFNDGAVAKIHRNEVNSQNNAKRTFKVDIYLNDKDGKAMKINKDYTPDVPKKVLDALDKHVPGPFSRSKHGWINEENQNIYSLDEILEMFPGLIGNLPEKYRGNPFKQLTDGLEVFFVETKRLDAEKSARQHGHQVNRYASAFNVFDDLDNLAAERQVLRVDQYSQDIAKRIKSALADYAKHSQESDRTFPERLVKFVRDSEKSLPEKALLDRMKELEKKRQRLIALGILDSESGLGDLTEEDVNKAPEALTIYVNDVQQKLEVFDELTQRIGKLIDIVNERFRYKTLTLHRDQGFRLHTYDSAPIKLEDLSSGEQNELVVLYELLFRAPKNGIVLVDEPEISLHVGWQSRFLNDLMGIMKLTQSYGIVATHSPVIIGTRWDLTEELSGPQENLSMDNK